MQTEPRTTDEADQPDARPSKARLLREQLEYVAESVWRSIDSVTPPPTGKAWLPIIASVAIFAASVLTLLVFALEGLGHLVEPGAEGWARADLAGLLIDPVRAYLTEHTVDVGVDARTVFWTWAAAGVVFFLLSIAGSDAARLGWTLHGAATALMVLVGTPDPGRPVATGLTVLFWTLLSVPAYRRRNARLRVIAETPGATAALLTVNRTVGRVDTTIGAMDLGMRQDRAGRR